MRGSVSSLPFSRIERAAFCAAAVACLAFSAAMAATADAQPAALRSFSVEPSCAGACSDPTLAQVDDGRVVALWSGEDDVWWAQSIDATKVSAIGRPERLGKLSVGRNAVAQGLSLAPLADGDLALFGVLPDGRITYARGSLAEGRRVAAKAITAPNDSKVLSMAAAALGQGAALLVLSGREGSKPGQSEPMQLVLSRLDGKGQALGPPLRWSAPKGADARLAVCGGQLYAAWSDAKRVVVRAVSPSLTLGNELFFPNGQRLRGLSPVFCESTEGRLLASYYRPGISVDAAPEVYVAKIPATATGKQTWKKIKVSGKPHQVFGVAGALAAHKTAQGLSVTLGIDGRAQTVALDPKHTALASARVEHAASDNCVLLSDGKRVLCAHGEDERLADDCWRAKSMTFALYGSELGPAPAKPALPAAYFSPPQIEAPDRPSKAQQAADSARLFCKDPAFDPLRKALDGWCEGEAQKSTKERYQYHAAFCRPGSNVLQDQLRACSDHPACPTLRDAHVPSIDRAEYANGTRIELKADNCSVWFSRLKDGSYRVTDRECVGDL